MPHEPKEPKEPALISKSRPIETLLELENPVYFSNDKAYLLYTADCTKPEVFYLEYFSVHLLLILLYFRYTVQLKRS